jgi:hypothetical protein
MQCRCHIPLQQSLQSGVVHGYLFTYLYIYINACLTVLSTDTNRQPNGKITIDEDVERWLRPNLAHISGISLE